VINALRAAKTAASGIQLKNTFWHYLMRQHLLPVAHRSRVKSLHHREGKNRIKSLRKENKGRNPFAFPHFLFVFWLCYVVLLPKAHFSLSWQFCWLVSSPAGFVCVCFPRWPITHLAKAQSSPIPVPSKLAKTGR